MKNNTFFVGAMIVTLLLAAGPVLAEPDWYMGDSAIYSSGSNTRLRPNVLLIIDNSNSTTNTASGSAYNPTTLYANAGWNPYNIYDSGQQGDYSGQPVSTNTSTALSSLTCAASKGGATALTKIITALQQYGTYAGSADTISPNIKANACDTSGQGALYALGNYLNYTKAAPAPLLVIGPDGLEYQLTNDHTSIYALDTDLTVTPQIRGNEPPTGIDWTLYWTPTGSSGHGAPLWTGATPYHLPGATDTQQKVVYDALYTVVGGARSAVNFGAEVYDQTGQKGGNIIYPISDLSSDLTFTTFMSKLPGGTPGTAVLTSNTARPQAEALFDAGYYFRGQALPIGGQPAKPSPITKTCDKNFIVLITNGASNKDDDTSLGTIVGDYDGDGAEASPYGLGSHYLDDVAKYLYETDNSSTLAGVQRISTSTILAFQNRDELVVRAADASHGRGAFYNVFNANDLAAALTDLFSNLVNECDTSFIAPVVPVSPENRTYSGSRIYMGFFRPQSNKYWLGNLKKYGLDNNNNITDKTGALANYLDQDGDGRDDRTLETILDGYKDGSFRGTSTSFWSAATDTGTVDAGGAGSVLVDPTVFTIDPTGANANSRKIYTWMNNVVKDLTGASNAFTTLNTALTPTVFGLLAADTTGATDLISWIHGRDVLDENADGSTTDTRRWILGDILHSKPVIVNYKYYTSDQESRCDMNMSVIYVGSNDGQLHAFRDCDGKELWSFIPPEILPKLRWMQQTKHYYYMDSTVSEYVYDANGNGTIDSGAHGTTDQGDKVMILFGNRRGNGTLSATAKGAYYALDVTDPSSPKILWTLNQNTALFGQMGESWSEPKIVKMNIATAGVNADKIVAIFGGGYDNCNEDGRYGNTQTFTGSCSAGTNSNSGAQTSGGNSAPITPRGTALYFLEVATLTSSGVTLTSDVTQLKRIVYGSPASSSGPVTFKTGMTFAIMSEVSPVDSDYDGYADKVYVGDAGGTLWRFNVGNSDRSVWTATKLFISNPGYTGFPPPNQDDGSKGRKIFYRPAVTVESGMIIVFFATGDREHPLNTAVTDRMYAVFDRGQTTPLYEKNLVDVTVDQLENGTATAEEADAVRTALAGTTYSGWYIRLDQNTGEKVLAVPTLFNKAVYFTTYTPNLVFDADPCLPGNLGTGRYYALKYKTGEAALDLSTGTGRSDRSKTLGAGIPSGLVVVVSQSGDIIGLVGSGGTITTQMLKATGGIVPLYWRQK